MSIYKFMNSKVLFKDVRNRPASNQPPMPVMVHISEYSKGLRGLDSPWRRLLGKRPAPHSIQ